MGKPRDHKVLISYYRGHWDVKCSCGWSRGDVGSEHAARAAWANHNIQPPDTRNPKIQVKR